MLKVLIVDDSALSRTDLKTMINWESNGFYISGEAGNGASAIQIIQNDRPDIVITDMNMPLVNGIGLIEYIENNCPQVRIIALSAFDDFDYVRQSMKKGAIDYVLKHRLHAGVLLDILEVARNSILKFENEQDKQSEIYIGLADGKVVLRQDFMHKLIIEGSLTDLAEIKSKIASLELEIDMESLVVAVVEIDDFHFIEEKYAPQEMDKLLKTFLDISKEILNDWDKSIIFHEGQGKFIIILSLGQVTSKMYMYNRLYGILNRIRLEIKKFLNITACFGVSKVSQTVLGLHQAYLDANTVLKNKFYRGKNGIFIEKTNDKYIEGFFCLDIKDEKAIYSALKSVDYENVEQRLDEVFNKISGLRLSRKSTQMICAELINIVNKVSKDTGMETARLYVSEDVSFNPYNRIQKYETLEEIKNWIVELVHKLMSMLERTKTDSQNEIAKKAVEFIHRNYRKDFSLTDVADFTGVSSSYLSRLFKEECRMGFVEYVNHVRVENAKQYIESGDHKLKEIVTQVGFNNYNYFFKVFKEVVGMTPHEYEQVCRE